MNILNIEHISKMFGDKVIFEDASFGVQEGDKIGIIGLNGTGKSTLLKLAAGKEEPDGGQITRQNGLKTAYLPQDPPLPKGETIAGYALSGNPDTDWIVMSNLTKLGLTDYDRELDSLSGGQRRKTALAKVLSEEFDLLLLDEPTNHLDDEMVAWLEDYLNNYKGTVLMVTHDRYFLDRTANRILEISRGKMYGYEAGYTQFLELKAQREEMELASERKRQSILRMEVEWAKRGCRARSTKQKARLMRLEELKTRKAPVQDASVEMESVGVRMGKKTIELHHISKGYGGKRLIDDFDYIVLKNQRLGIIGPNGSGKSTLIKLMGGLLAPDEGEVEIGETVRIGYFAQEVPDMDDSRRVIDYIKDIAEYVQTAEGRISASQMLERFLFTPQMQYTPIAKLSGGEKRRLYLLRVLMQGVNVLLLDEPSNDLDIPTLAILEDYLSSFSGIVIAVSHDRYFLDNVADRIFELDGHGRIRQYEGGYTDYLEAKKRCLEETAETEAGRSGTGAKENTPSGEASQKKIKSWKGNRPAKLKFTFKEQREYETIDEDIERLEGRIEELEGNMVEYATNSAKLSEIMKESEEAKKALEEKMERWVYLNDLAEQIEAQKSEQ